jgi:hypothetical protein
MFLSSALWSVQGKVRVPVTCPINARLQSFPSLIHWHYYPLNPTKLYNSPGPQVLRTNLAPNLKQFLVFTQRASSSTLLSNPSAHSLFFSAASKMAYHFPFDDAPLQVLATCFAISQANLTHSEFTGRPIRFNVGPEPWEFDIHHDRLIAVSPLFTDPSGIPHLIPFDIELPITDPDIFHVVCQWLYNGNPPDATTARDLLELMQSWVVLGKLGVWDKQNTIMRLGMALMQPKKFVCEIATVKWVYENTEPGCKLRGYIHRDASAFMRIFENTRRANPKVKAGHDLGQQFDTVIERTVQSNELAWVLTFGEQVDESKLDYVLPSSLVWGDKWQDLPDEHYFVGPVSVVEQGGAEVASQIGVGRVGM